MFTSYTGTINIIILKRLCYTQPSNSIFTHAPQNRYLQEYSLFFLYCSKRRWLILDIINRLHLKSSNDYPSRFNHFNEYLQSMFSEKIRK